MAEGAPPPPQPPLLETLENNNNNHQNNNNNHINTAATSNNNNNNHHSKLCGMLGINMPCEAAGHDFSTVVRKELEYANSIASHYGAAVAAAAGLDKSAAAAAATVPLELQQQQQQHQRGASSFKIEVSLIRFLLLKLCDVAERSRTITLSFTCLPSINAMGRAFQPYYTTTLASNAN